MSGSLGVKIGTACFATAAEAGSVRPAASVRAASRPATTRHAATLLMSHDMAPTLAPLADGVGPVGHGLAVNGFVDRIGDPIDLIAADGSPHRPEVLVAAAVRYLTRYSAGAFAGTPAIAATYPSHWKTHEVQALREALDRLDMTRVALVPEVASILAQVESTRGLPSDGIVVVYDLGGNGLSVSLARGTEQIGGTIRTVDFGGAHIDDAIVRHVLRVLDGELTDVDLADPALLTPLRALRARCRQAKETLSAETAAVVEVELGRVRQDVRLVRPELEELIREPVAGSLGLVGEALRANDIDAREVRAVVLAGGAAATPLVAELLSAEFHVPVMGEPESLLTSAMGAALLARSSVNAIASVPVPSTPEAKPHTPRREFEPDPSAGMVASKPPLVIAPPDSVAADHSAAAGGRRKWAILAAAAVAALAAAIVGGVAIGGSATGPKPTVNEQVLIPPAGPIAERPDGTGIGTGPAGTGGSSDSGKGSDAGQSAPGGGPSTGGTNGTGSAGTAGTNGAGTGRSPAGGPDTGGTNGSGSTGTGTAGTNGPGTGRAPVGGGSDTGGTTGAGTGTAGTNGSGTGRVPAGGGPGTGGSNGAGSTGSGSGGTSDTGSTGSGAGQAPAGGGAGTGGTSGTGSTGTGTGETGTGAGGTGPAPTGGSDTGGSNGTGSTGTGTGETSGTGAGGTGPSTGPAPTGTAAGGTNGTGTGTGGSGANPG